MQVKAAVPGPFARQWSSGWGNFAPLIVRVTPAGSSARDELHGTSRDRGIQQAKATVLVLEKSTGPASGEPKLIPVKQDGGLSPVADADGRGLVAALLACPRRIVDGRIKERTGIHFAQSAVNPVP